jgi:hypothetical protein
MICQSPGAASDKARKEALAEALALSLSFGMRILGANLFDLLRECA